MLLNRQSVVVSAIEHRPTLRHRRHSDLRLHLKLVEGGMPIRWMSTQGLHDGSVRTARSVGKSRVISTSSTVWMGQRFAQTLAAGAALSFE